MKKIKLYGILINGQFVVAQMHLHEDTAFKAAHQVHYERFYKDNVQLVECNIKYEVIKQISQPKDKVESKPLKKRKKLRRRLKA